MQQVIRGNRVLHDAQVGGTLEQVLPLSASILGPDLLTVDALHGQTL